jgi:hypothetical protein
MNTNNSYFTYLFILSLFALATVPLFYFFHLSGIPSSLPRTSFDNIKSLVYSEVIDFENPETRYQQYSITNEKAYSGEYSCKFDSNSQYGYGFTILADRVLDSTEIRTVGFETVLLSYDTLKNVSHVISIEDMNNKSVFWYSSTLDSLPYNWQPTEAIFQIPSGILKKHYRIKLYLWNRNKQLFYADDYKIWFSSDSIARSTRNFFFKQPGE